MSMMASAAFIWRNISVSMTETLFSLFHHIGAIEMLYLAIAIVVMQNRLCVIFEKLSVIYDESKASKFEVKYLCNKIQFKCR